MNRIWGDGLDIEGNGFIEGVLTVGSLNVSPGNNLYVSVNGSDTTGNGSILNPYATIAKALSTVVSPSSSNRWAINVGPGSFSTPFQIKPWCAIVGVAVGANGAGSNGSSLTEISALANTCGFDASFSGAGLAVGWYAHLGFVNAQTWDQAVQAPGCQPQLNFMCCAFASGATYNGTGTVGFDNVLWEMCLSYGGVTVNGWQFFFTRHSEFLGGTCTIHSGPVGATESTKWLAQATAIGSDEFPTNVLVQWASPSPAGAMAICQLDSSNLEGNLTLDGLHTSFVSNIEGIPDLRDKTITLLNSAPIAVLDTPATSMAYAPAVLANWNNSAPTSVSNALDRIAAKIMSMTGSIG